MHNPIHTGHTLLQHNGNSGELIIYSGLTGEAVFCGVVKDLALANQISKAIRKAERIILRKASPLTDERSILPE